MKKYLLLSVILFNINLFAQSSAGANANIEYPSLIDVPTAGVLDKGNVGLGVYFMPLGVVISKIEVGVFDNFSIGVSYGAANFIGMDSPKWYKLPGVSVKLRIIDESLSMPAFALGFDSQGKGEFDNELNRFKIKSSGFYFAASKNFSFLGFLGLHGALNYSLENEDGDKDIDFSFGFEKTLGSNLSVVGEYDLAINDNARRSYGAGNGYLNMGVRWSFGNGLTLGFDLRDLLSNKKLNTASADRAVKVEFIKSMF